MRGADTNLLVRLLMRDDAAQLGRVVATFERCRTDGESVFLPLVVLCELTWVLQSRYREPAAVVQGCIEDLLETDGFILESEDIVRAALAAWKAGKADFSDYVIGLTCQSMGCRDTVTFDQALRGAAGFTVLS